MFLVVWNQFFVASYRRKILDEAGTAKDFLLTDYALEL
jgi:hypothetical protein